MEMIIVWCIFLFLFKINVSNERSKRDGAKNQPTNQQFSLEGIHTICYGKNSYILDFRQTYILCCNQSASFPFYSYNLKRKCSMFVNCQTVRITNDCNDNGGGLDCEKHLCKFYIELFYLRGEGRRIEEWWQQFHLVHFSQNVSMHLSCTMHKCQWLLNKFNDPASLRTKCKIEWKPFLYDRSIDKHANQPAYVWPRYPFVWLSIVVRRKKKFRCSLLVPLLTLHPSSLGMFVSIWVLACLHSSWNPISDSTYLPKSAYLSLCRLFDISFALYAARIFHNFLLIQHTHSAHYNRSARRIVLMLICKVGKSHIFAIICNFRYGERVVMHTRCSPISPSI